MSPVMQIQNRKISWTHGSLPDDKNAHYCVFVCLLTEANAAYLRNVGMQQTTISKLRWQMHEIKELRSWLVANLAIKNWFRRRRLTESFSLLSASGQWGTSCTILRTALASALVCCNPHEIVQISECSHMPTRSYQVESKRSNPSHQHLAWSRTDN